MFNPEAVIAHCFKQFKQEDFHLPRSRRRVIILPQKEAPKPVCPMPQPQTLLEPTPSPKAPEVGDTQEQPEDPRAWLRQRLKMRKDLESFGNVERWLQNKASLTLSEAKVLRDIHKKQPVARLPSQLAMIRDTAVSSPVCQAQTLWVLGACCHSFPLTRKGRDLSPYPPPSPLPVQGSPGTEVLKRRCTCDLLLGFPGGSDSKESACNAGDPGSIPESGRSPEAENGYPLQYS